MDGSVIVGSSSAFNATRQAFRWTQGGGSMQGLGDLAGGSFRSFGAGVSGDGLTAVGRGVNSSNREEAFRWNQNMFNLGFLPGHSVSRANAIAADVLVIVGESTTPFMFGQPTPQPQAFRWSVVTGMVGLGDLPGGSIDSEATAISADGSVVVGSSWSAAGLEAFRWTQGGGMIGLGDLAGGGVFSSAGGVSADGSVVVGLGTSAAGNEAFRWTQGGGMVALGDLPGGFVNSFARGVTADGSIIVGRGETAAGNAPFVWCAARGMVDLQDLLANTYGIDLTGWTLTSANAITPDGRTIIGDATHAPIFEAWRVQFPTPSCAGDADGNGVVDFGDITGVLGNWLKDYRPFTGPGDANGDGLVNFADITAVLGNWLNVCP